VVTRSAGDGIRVDVRAVDTQADYRGRLIPGLSFGELPGGICC